MDKKIITFFLASSITDLDYDRLAVGDFIMQLNNVYQSSGIYIHLHKCESDTMDHSICGGGSQHSLDEIIKQSDICFVIFWRKAGEVTFHELEVAIDSYKKNSKPKIVVYFKNTGESPTDDIKEVMRIIDDELLHYHREYSHIDSLKLGIITQLQVHGFVNADITVKDNSIMCDNKKVMTVDSIPLFSDNSEYLDLLERHTNAVARCEELQIAYASDNSNYKIYRELSKAIKERDRIKADIDELTENILNVGNSIVSMTSNGKTISDNIRRAIKCFDAGDYDGVLEALNPADIEKSVAELDKIENSIIEERIAVVEQYRMRILALKAQANWSEVHEMYFKAVAQVENRENMPKTVMYEYATFLFQQTQYKKCIEICLSLEKSCGIEDDVAKRKMGKIKNLLGLAYYQIGKYAEAEEKLSSSMDIRKEFSSTNQTLNFEYAETCSNLARVYYYLDKHNQADKLYNEALSVYNSADESDSIRIKIVDINISLAQLYYQTNKHMESEELLKDALEVAKELAKTHPNYEEYVADLNSRLAHINRAIMSHRKSDRYFVEALKKRSALLQGDKKAFQNFLEQVCNVLSHEYSICGFDDYAMKIKKCIKSIDKSAQSEKEAVETDFTYYGKTINLMKIEDWCTKALEIYRKLAKQNPEAYEGKTSQSCRSLAEFYTQVEELEQAKLLLDEAIDLQNKIQSFDKEQEKDQANPKIAEIYCSYATLYSQKSQFMRAENMYQMALDIYRDLSFTNELARTYNHYGMLQEKFGKTQEATQSYFQSLLLYLGLYRKSPSAYVDRVINTLANSLHSLCPQREKEIMSKLLLIS